MPPAMKLPNQYWHCRVRPKGTRLDSILTDLDSDYLTTMIVEPFRSGKDFSFGGRLVNSSLLERIQIIQTSVRSIDLAASLTEQGLKLGMLFGMDSQQDPFFRGAGIDYTNELLFRELKVSQLLFDFVVVTALQEEFEAIVSHLPGCEKLPPSDNDTRVFFQSCIDVNFPDGSTGNYSLALVCLNGMGRVKAAIVTHDAIKRFSPRYILLVGIAGGFSCNDVSVGDVLVSDQVVDYELQKVRPKNSSFRFSSHPADQRLLNAANHYKISECLSSMKVLRPESGTPKMHFGPIATGDKVVANKAFFSRFFKSYPKAIGVEMESGGVASAAFDSPNKPGFFMIRATSDLADESKDSVATQSWRFYCCDLAACYAINFLKSGPITTSFTNSRRVPERIIRPISNDETDKVEVLDKITEAKKQILIRAGKCQKQIQTVLRTGTNTPFSVAMGSSYPYSGDEDVFLFVEALKQLISEGCFEEHFERASKTYHLTYEGLQRFLKYPGTGTETQVKYSPVTAVSQYYFVIDETTGIVNLPPRMFYHTIFEKAYSIPGLPPWNRGEETDVERMNVALERLNTLGRFLIFPFPDGGKDYIAAAPEHKKQLAKEMVGN